MRERTTAVRVGSCAAAVVAASLALAPPAGADACSECKAPSAAEVRAAAGTALDEAGRYYEIDGGECSIVWTGQPPKQQTGQWPIWEAHDTAWNCPESKKDGDLSFKLTKDKRFEWTVTVEAGSTLDAWIAEVAAKMVKELTAGGGEEVEVTVHQHIEAKYCHRIEYWAKFFVGDVEADWDFALKRRFRWWVKSHYGSSSAVYASGDLYSNCGSGTAKAKRLEPLDLSIGQYDHGCKTGDCKDVPPSKWIGWFPPLPPGWDPFGPDGPYGRGRTKPDDPENPEDPTEPDPDGGGEEPGTTPDEPAPPAPETPPDTPGSGGSPGSPGTPPTTPDDDGPTQPGVPVTPGQPVAPPPEAPAPPEWFGEPWSDLLASGESSRLPSPERGA